MGAHETITKLPTRFTYDCRYADFRFREAAAAAAVERRGASDPLQRAMDQRNPPRTAGRGTPAFIAPETIGLPYMSLLQQNMLPYSQEPVGSISDQVRAFERQLNAVAASGEAPWIKTRNGKTIVEMTRFWRSCNSRTSWSI